MRVLVFGGMHMRGKSSKTGASYDMARLYVASDIKSQSKDAYTRVGVGFEAAEVECDEAVIHQLQGHSFPKVMTLITDMRMQGGKLVPVVTGIAPDKAAA